MLMAILKASFSAPWMWSKYKTKYTNKKAMNVENPKKISFEMYSISRIPLMDLPINCIITLLSL